MKCFRIVLSCACLLAVFFVMVPFVSADPVSLVFSNGQEGYYSFNSPSTIKSSYSFSSLPSPYFNTIFYPISNSTNYPKSCYLVLFSGSFYNSVNNNNVIIPETLYSGSLSFISYSNSSASQQRPYFMDWLNLDDLDELSISFFLADNSNIQSASHLQELFYGTDLILTSTSVSSASVPEHTEALTTSIDFQFYFDDSIDWSPTYLICTLDFSVVYDYYSMFTNFCEYRFCCSSFNLSYDPDAPDPFLPPPSPPAPASYLPLYGEGFFIQQKLGSSYSSSSVTGDLTLLDQYTIDSYDPFGFAFGAEASYRVVEDGELVYYPYYFPDSQSFSGYITGDFMLNSGESQDYDLSKVTIRPFIARSTSLNTQYSQPLFIDYFLGFDDYWVNLQFSPVPNRPDQFTAFSCQFYFKLPAQFNRLYNNEYFVIGVYLDFSQIGLESPASEDDILVSFVTWNFTAGYKSPVPNPSDDPTNGSIQDILDQFLDPDYPNNYLTVLDAGAMEDSILSGQSGGIDSFLDITSGLVNPLTAFSNGFSFFQHVFDYLIPTGSWLHYLLIISLALGVFGLLLNLAPHVLSKWR